MRPEAERSGFPKVACATDGTVSVSTVMLSEGASVLDLTVESDEKEAFGESMFGRWAGVDATRSSCTLRLFSVFSLPLSPCLLDRTLRSSVTFGDVTSCRSSSENLGPRAEDVL